MPNLEPVVLQQDQVRLRHIGPASAILPATSVVAQSFAVLSKSLAARPLPTTNLPTSPDFVSGSWTGRLGDAGEATFTFPNGTSSDGIPWRSRFDPTGHLQFLEVSFDGIVDFAGVIDQVAPSQQSVTVHAYDGWWLLKKAYERDWTVTMAPRDVIERGTQVWVPSVADTFPAGALSSQWTAGTNAGGTVAIGSTGGLVLTVPATNGAYATISSNPPSWTATTWSASATVQYTSVSGGSYCALKIGESPSGVVYEVYLYAGYAILQDNSGVYQQIQIQPSPSYSLRMESDGQWVLGFVNGQLIGALRRTTSAGQQLQTVVQLYSGGSAAAATVTLAISEALQPFLQRGSDKGDYVLPGTASTYPSGGLHARYFNDLDLQGDPDRLRKILAPPRTQAYSGSGTAEYANQQDTQINLQGNPTPGAAGSNWSCVWFGAIYLKLSTNTYSFQVATPTGSTAVRVWIGQTQFGQQCLDQWALQTGGTFNFNAPSLAGTPPYGGATVLRDGWYPVRIEYAVDATATTAPIFKFGSTGPSYVDPGGTTIASGFTGVVPATSLSPLGCVDQRYQGISHFDLVQQTAQGYGYQAAVEPKQLESGLFPGVLAPRIREGHDTDVILEPDTGPRQDAEGILNYSSTLDAADFASSLQGNGAGFQSGTTGQLQAVVFDPATLTASLFDAQAWQDYSDASFTSLLQALLNAQLGLQLTPWQLLSADPTGRPRRAFTWPLPGAIQTMRWRPGDGVRIRARDINVFDTSPRQMLVVTRNLTPNGLTATQATFANRPKTPALALKRQLYSATRQQRNYQRQLVTLTGNYVTGSIAAGATGATSILALLPGDVLVRAWLRIPFSGAAVSFSVYINGNPADGTLKGPWTTVPINLNITAVAAVGNNLRAWVKNNSATIASAIEYQVIADVLR